MELAIEVAALKESLKSAHKRIGEITEIASGIHDLSNTMAQMTVEIRMLTKQVGENSGRVEKGLTAQGERIGSLERMVQDIQRNETRLDKLEKRINDIEQEPATKWKNLSWLIVTGVAMAVLGFVLAKVM